MKSEVLRLTGPRTLGDAHAKEFDALVGRLLLAQLQSLGLFIDRPTSTLTRQDAGILARYHRWLDASLAMLVDHGYVTCDGQAVTTLEQTPVDPPDLWAQWEACKKHWRHDADLNTKAELAEQTLRSLSDVLTGKRPATEVLFQSFESVEALFQKNSLFASANEMVAATLVTYIQECVGRAPATSPRTRILEIGAGTGGTSATVFQKLTAYQEYIETYCYSDVSRAFLAYGRRKYGRDYPYLTYSLFDVELPIEHQAIQPGSYDVVIAANVLHATADIRNSVRNTKKALARDGLLILNEMTGKSLFTHVTFGLLDGWWAYQDAALRVPGCPALAPVTWRRLLESEGFRAVEFPAESLHQLGHQVVVARSESARA